MVAGRRTGTTTVRIGLTGPIGCGKSTVAGWLAELGATVIDADELAHAVAEPGQPALSAIVERFGPSALRPDGWLDRPALGRIVFADPTALAALEAIVHPAVRERIVAEVAAAERGGAPAIVIEAIKLVEGGLAAGCDEVWLVVCEQDEQRRRLRGRGTTDADIEQRLAAQGDLAKRLGSAATRVIGTDEGRDVVRERVAAAYLDALARGRRSDRAPV